MWSNLEEITKDPCCHHDKFPTCASPGKAANGQDGCRHHDNPSNACPGKASTAKKPAIIALAVIMTTHPTPALARHQMAEG
jgi:hypothetical protein